MSIVITPSLDSGGYNEDLLFCIFVLLVRFQYPILIKIDFKLTVSTSITRLAFQMCIGCHRLLSTYY